ncbi:MAG: hypothetical protein ISS89_00855 [Candidatus Omnitrophica bacterium]|nr:hypothetical protein [Candidatus Omnitrophota bacterium]
MPGPVYKKSSFVFFGQSGCLLALAIAFNLIFGWLLLPPLAWLSLEGILILLFVINAKILMRKISSLSCPPGRRDEVIDVESEP